MRLVLAIAFALGILGAGIAINSMVGTPAHADCTSSNCN